MKKRDEPFSDAWLDAQLDSITVPSLDDLLWAYFGA
jgi:hypothetical protein